MYLFKILVILVQHLLIPKMFLLKLDNCKKKKKNFKNILKMLNWITN